MKIKCLLTYEGNDKSMENIKNVFIGVAISLTLTMLLLLIFSIILTYTNVSENTMTPVIIVVTAISILFRKFTCKYEN